jgi:hypothetical protein
MEDDQDQRRKQTSALSGVSHSTQYLQRVCVYVCVRARARACVCDIYIYINCPIFRT